VGYELSGAFFRKESSSFSLAHMNAIFVRSPGGPEALEVLDVPVPEPGLGQLRIRMQAAAVNPVDVATRSGQLTELGLVSPSERLAIGWDVAGLVDALGPGVRGLSTGEAVIGLRDRLSAPIGAQAEFVVLDVGAVARAPRSVTPIEAATLPLNALTAEQALDLVDLRPGETLLVTGAAGALGGFAVQVAALRGLRVVATASARDESLVRELGAELFVPRTPALGDAVRAQVPGGVDAAIDAAVIGASALDAVRNGGSFVAVAAGAAPTPLRGTRVQNVWIRADAVQLAEKAALVDAGRLTLRVADTMHLTDVAHAHERLARETLRGRLVLVPSTTS
jgi:NADPH:quinone reductase-like Zn-dependent oxidoreductase